MPQFVQRLCRKMRSMYRIKYVNFNLVPFCVRNLRGGETYLLNNPRIPENFFAIIPKMFQNFLQILGLEHTCRQNPRLPVDKSPILSVN